MLQALHGPVNDIPQISIEHRDPSRLKNHPLSQQIYADVADAEFVDSCKHGIDTPLLITTGDVIISGHRRNQAARINGLKTVPVIVRRDLADPLEIERLLIVSNSQREKSNEQKTREYKRLREIETEQAKKRQSHGKTAPGKRLGKSSTKRSDSASRSIDRAASQVGLSGKTAEKALEVVDEIDAARKAGDDAKADDLADTLNTNVARAHRKVKPPPEVTFDSLRRAVPEKLIPIFEAVHEFKTLMSKLASVKAVVKTLCDMDAGVRIQSSALIADINNARSHLKFAMPYTVCPYCSAKKKQCDACKGLGWVGQLTYKQAPREMK